MGIILAIDYGTKYIGLAVSDETKQIAAVTPTVLVPRGRKPLSALLKVLPKYDIEKYLVGMPTGLDNKPTRISREVNEFAKELAERTGIAVIFWNETLSSQMADSLPIRKGSNDSHSQAARILLQEYLDNLSLGK